MIDNMEDFPGEGAQTTPTTVASSTSGQQPSAIDVKAIAEALRPIIAEEVERKNQSIKDRRIAALRGDVDELLARYDELLKEGLSPVRARRELQIDQLLKTQLSNPDSAAPASQVAGNQPEQAVFDHTVLLENLGLDPNSPEVLSVMRNVDDLAQQIVAFGKLAAQKRVKPPSNLAQQVPMGGGSSATSRTIEDVEADLAALKNSDPNYLGSKRHRELVEEHRRLLQRQY